MQSRIEDKGGLLNLIWIHMPTLSLTCWVALGKGFSLSGLQVASSIKGNKDFRLYLAVVRIEEIVHMRSLLAQGLTEEVLVSISEYII